jgi:hypothetical protein
MMKEVVVVQPVSICYETQSGNRKQNKDYGWRTHGWRTAERTLKFVLLDLYLG